MNNKELLVFPTSRAIRGYISGLEDINTFLPKAISIGDFFQRTIYTPEKKQILPELKIIYLQKAIQNCDVEALGINSDFSSFLKQSEYIFRFFNELASEFKTIEDLHSADTYALYLDHLLILQKIQKNYYKILEENNYIDQSLVPSYYKINEDYIRQFEKITIFHEGIFSGFELKVIDDISKIIPIDIQIKEQIKKDNYDVNIVSISQRILQVGFIKQQIYTMVTNDKIDPSNIAVILPDESFHEILTLFNEEQYFNFAMGNSIKNNKIIKIISTINRFLINHEPKDNEKIEVFDINKEFLEEIIKPNWQQKISKDIFDEIFNYLASYEDDEHIIEKLNELKLSLDILFFTNELDITLKDIFKITQDKLNSITIDDTHGGKITVLGLLETRAVSFDGVIVIDFNDDKIPKRSIKDKFLSTAVKEFAGLPTSQNREDLQKYYYKNLFDGAKKIAISYVDDEASTKSRFINEIFPNIKDDIQAYDFSKILYKSKEFARYKKDIIVPMDLSKRSWSATSLKSYLSCKRKFYFTYILKIKEHQMSLKPAGFELGDIVHKILEKLSSTTFDTISINNEISKYQNKNPYLTMELEVWKKKLEKFTLFEKQREEQGITIFEVEKEFNFEYKGIKLTGKIDRIDKIASGKYEILDYKTSSNLKIDTAKTFTKSVDFQLEFYALSQRDKMCEKVGYYDLSTSTIKSEIMLDEKIELLDEKLEELKTKIVDFKLCDDVSHCLYCPYKIMCERE